VSTRQPIWGLMAEFSDLQKLVHAAERVKERGYKSLDAYTPFPCEELNEIVAGHHNVLPLVTLIGGIVGCASGLGMQYWTSAVDYPINIGGRPLFSWPQFIPVTFELTILNAALFCVVALILVNGLPLPYHPVFNVDRFALASNDRFFLTIESDDPLFDREETRRFLEGLGPEAVSEVEH